MASGRHAVYKRLPRDHAIDTTSDFETLSEVSRFVARFEDGTLPRERWNHPAHLTVAAWYLLQHDEAEATRRIVSGIQRYNRKNCIPVTPTGGYHETLTLFWIAIVRDRLRSTEGERALLRVRDVLAAFGQHAGLFREYYSDERLFSAEARASWVEPDRQAL